LVNAEEPEYQFSGDLQDIQDADPDWSAQHLNVHYLVPKRRHLEIHFSVLRDGSPSDVDGLMRQVLEKANQQTPRPGSEVVLLKNIPLRTIHPQSGSAK
jgi:hypothetical protein